MKRTVSGIFFVLLLASTLTATFNVQAFSVKASLREESGQAKIVEHRITAAELEKMKEYLGVSDGGNHNLIINGHGTGLRAPTEEEWTQIAAKAMVVDTISLGSVNQPPGSVDWSASAWFPPIGDQDGQGSCVSWAVGYYTKTFQEAKEHGWNLTGARWKGGYPIGYPTPEYQDKIISPAFVYHLTNGGIDTGSFFYDAINLVCSIGACSWAKMPWNPFDQATWPSENAWREAAYYRGASTQFELIYVNPPFGILALKNLITSGNLAQIGVDGFQLKPWVLTSQDVWTLDNYNPGGINHANTIVGYDDSFPYTEQGQTRYGAFKIANSWGVARKPWENVPDGCYWISYKAMSQRVQYAMFYRDRIGYVPTLTSYFRIEHPLRGDCKITIGMGTHDNPDVSKSFTDYISGGNFSFCPNNIVFDITEFKDVVPKIYGQQFFIRVYDSGTSTTGTILYFAVEDTVSSDPPVATVNRGFVFADLIFGAWPMFHHDLSHTGTSPSTGPNTNNTLWTYTTGSAVDSSPAVFGGLVYVGSNDWNVYCLDATSGALVWRYTTGSWVESSPAVFGGLVFVGSDDYNVYCLNAATGALVWNYTTGGYVWSSPAVVGGLVYVNVASFPFPIPVGWVYCLNATTGALVWNYTTGSYVWSSPAVVGGLAYVGSNDGNVYCLNAATGALVWNYTTGGGFSSPAVTDGLVYVGSYDQNVYCLNATTGSLVWSFTTGGDVFSSPAVVGGLVYVGSYDQNVYCLNATTGSLVWSFTTGDLVWSSPAVVGGLVYVGSFDWNVYCLNATTGWLVWSYKTGDWVYSSPAVVGGLVYVGSCDGNVYCLNAATGALVWNYTTGGAVRSSPAVVNGVVYGGSDDGKIYAFGGPLTVSISPTSVTMDVGQSKLFTSTVSGGTSPYSYQWYLNGAPVSSATNPNWTFMPASVGSYTVYVKVADAAGTQVTSNTAIAEVNICWPMFHHDLSHTGTSPSTGPNTNNTLWTYTTGSAVDSSPAVFGGLVYVGSNDWNVYCLDATSGALVWRYTTGSWVESSPAVFGGLVFVGSDDYNVYCLNAATGALVWNYTTGGYVYSSPAVVGGLVYVGSGDNSTYCLNATTGSLVWSYKTGSSVWSSPAVFGGLVYVGSGYPDDHVYCLNATTGALVWSYKTGSYVWSCPAVVGGLVYVGSGDNSTYCLNAATGALVWSYKTGSSVWSSPAVFGGLVYVGSGDNSTYCLNATTGALVWSYKTGSSVWSSPAVADGKVYVGSDDCNVYCLNALSGARIWSYRTDSHVESSPAVAYGKVYIGSFDNRVYAFGVHDVAVTNVRSSKTVVGQGYSAIINVTVANQGSYPETFNVTARADAVGVNGGLVGYWSFDEGSGTTAHDSSGNLNDGTIYGATWTDGKFGKALSFDGIDDYVAVPGSPSLNNISDAVTIAAWVKLEQIPNEAYELISAGGYSYVAYAYVADPAGVRFNFGRCTAPGVGDDLQQEFWKQYGATLPYLPYNQWYYVVWMYDSSGYAAIYVNGQPYANTTLMSGKIHNFGWGLTIDGPSHLHKGIIDEVRIYNRTLSQQEIRAVAGSGAIQTQTVSLTSGDSTTLTFTWNTAGFAKGNYTIKAVADTVRGETDTADNTLVYGTVIVTIPGDVVAPYFEVDIYDVTAICICYDSKIGQPLYYPNCDLDGNGIIDIYDVTAACITYGQKDP